MHISNLENPPHISDSEIACVSFSNGIFIFTWIGTQMVLKKQISNGASCIRPFSISQAYTSKRRILIQVLPVLNAYTKSANACIPYAKSFCYLHMHIWSQTVGLILISNLINNKHLRRCMENQLWQKYTWSQLMGEHPSVFQMRRVSLAVDHFCRCVKLIWICNLFLMGSHWFLPSLRSLDHYPESCEFR